MPEKLEDQLDQLDQPTRKADLIPEKYRGDLIVRIFQDRKNGKYMTYCHNIADFPPTNSLEAGLNARMVRGFTDVNMAFFSKAFKFAQSLNPHEILNHQNISIADIIS